MGVKIKTFRVLPALPEKLAKLRELGINMYWSWNLKIISLFRQLDRELWEQTGHNPILMLGLIKQKRLESAARDEGFLSQLDNTYNMLQKYLTEDRWFQKTHDQQQDLKIAYFSMEYGITECLPVYSGGLGILAGDHLKASSDLGIPLVGVGLLYQQGYFQQYLNIDGWQQESYPDNDFHNLPLELVYDENGKPVTISVKYPGRKVFAQIWKAQVGRIPLYLLDCNIPMNAKSDQDITDQLYGGDLEMRIKQEFMLGIGGIRALKTIGIQPTVCHMNEGHSAFLALERIRLTMKRFNLSFHEALEATLDGNIFTTHTPVPAGIDKFPVRLMETYFQDYINELGISRSEFLQLGQENRMENEEFNMAVLALRLSSSHNGVSKIHGEVSRKMWKSVWPEFPEREIPITHITNGVHIPSWISNDMKELLDRYLGPRWTENPGDKNIWNRVDQIPDEELWRTHQRRKERLVAFARKRLREQLERRGASPIEIERANEALNSEYLTIGFARRFATYKRAMLIFRDMEKVREIFCNTDKPVQLIFAGKAHPKDREGKDLIRQIVNISQMEEFRRRIVFLEGYDMMMSRYLVQGVDVWLNTPRRLMEASGTSGMKVPANGGINCSILDGWWIEAYNIQTGWTIGKDEVYEDLNYQDEVESNALMNILKKEIVPLYYDRGPDKLPRRWIGRMKSSMRKICPVFNSNRMVYEYLERSYIAANERWKYLVADNCKRSKILAKWKKKMVDHWDKIQVLHTKANIQDGLKVGENVEIEASVMLGELDPSDVTVQVYYGELDNNGQIIHGLSKNMELLKQNEDQSNMYSVIITCCKSGLHGYAIRVMPYHENLDNPAELALICWNDS